MSNPYKILGVKKTDSKKNIAKAYRILAKKWHPDKHLNNKNYAEDKFKEISKAYQQIVNPERMCHNNGVFTPEFDEEKINKFTENILEKGKQFSDWFVKLKKMDFSNLTDNFLKEAVKYKGFYDGVTKTSKTLKKTEDIILNLTVKLEDIYNNIEKTLSIKHTRKCKTCLGIGFTMKGICDECQGDKYKEYNKEIKFHSSQKYLILKEQSNEQEGFIPGDIIINITPKIHSNFCIINNYDILYQVDLNTIEFKYLNDKTYKINKKNIIKNKKYKIPELGLLDMKKQRGNLYIQPIESLKSNYSNLNDSLTIELN